MVWICPNPQCPFEKALKEGSICPACGSRAQQLGSKDIVELMRLKHEAKEKLERQCPATKYEGEEAVSPSSAPFLGFIGHEDIRILIAIVLSIAFLLSLYSVASIPPNLWRYIDSSTGATLAFDILVGFCVALLSYIVYLDGNEIKRLKQKVEGAKP